MLVNPLLGKPRHGLKAKAGKGRSAPCLAPALARRSHCSTTQHDQPPHKPRGTCRSLFFCRLKGGGAGFTFQLNHPSTAEGSKVPSGISSCSGVERCESFEGTLPLNLIKPSENQGTDWGRS